MTSKILTIVVAGITALMLLGAPVNAGPKGKKLNFGGNLGTFTATPTRGYSGKKKSSSGYRKKKAAKRKAAARRKAAIKRAKLKKAAAYKKQKLNASRKAKVAATRKAKADAAREARLRGREERARIRRRNAEERERQKANLKSGDEADSDSNVDDVEISEDIDEKTLAEARLDEDAGLEEPATSENAVSCKKYIPSAGLTVTVPCDNQ